jgi:hypothetical protein
LLAIRLTLSVSSFHDPGDAGHLGLRAELALDPHLAGDAGDLGAEAAELLDHAVDRAGVLEEVAAQRLLDRPRGRPTG